MHNGNGLQTARGSGTNGHVQTNRFFINPGNTSGGGAGGSHMPPHPDADGGWLGEMMRKPNKEVLEHDRKGQVELELLVLTDALEERGYTEDEVEERVEEARKAAAAEEAGSGLGAGRSPPPPPGRGFTDTQSHHDAARKEKQLEALRAAFVLDVEDTKKGDGESDVECGEIVDGKYYEELDAAREKDNKDSKVAKIKSQKEKGTTTRAYADVQEGPSVRITFIMGKRKTKEEEERDNNKWGRGRAITLTGGRKRKTKEEEERDDERVLSSFSTRINLGT